MYYTCCSVNNPKRLIISVFYISFKKEARPFGWLEDNISFAIIEKMVIIQTIQQKKQ
jgi:hypothetical protein